MLYSHIDPKLTIDPLERRRVTAKIADETFEKIITLLQNQTVQKGPDGRDLNWNDLAGQVLTPVAQKLLNTNTELRFKYHPEPCMGLGIYSPPEKHVNGLGSSREELGQVLITRPHYLQYDFSNPAHRQAFYGPFIHELHHMTRSYALDHSVESLTTTHKRPAKDDPLKSLYTDAIVGPSIGGVPTVLTDLLAEENPHLSKDIMMDFGTAANEMKASTIQSYWEPLQKMWERTDFPLLNRTTRLKQRFDELLDKGDPAIIKEMIEDKLVNELESYMTCLRKAPGVPKDKLQPPSFSKPGLSES